MTSLSTMKTTTTYIGIDISKTELLLAWDQKPKRFPNTPDGMAALLKKCPFGSHLAVEATGGYERLLVEAAQAKEIPVSILDPARVRLFARAQGQRAKTDPLDAEVIRQYAQSTAPRPSPAPDPAVRQLGALADARETLMATRTQFLNFIEHSIDKVVTALYKEHLRLTESSVAALEQKIARLIAATPTLCQC